MSAREDRLLFAAVCVDEVLPACKEPRKPKKVMFPEAAHWGMNSPKRPAYFRSATQLSTYIAKNWADIRPILADDRGVLPTYAGHEGGSGGGYRRGNAKLTERQLKVEKKVVEGVVGATNAFAESAHDRFPQLEVYRTHTVQKLLT